MKWLKTWYNDFLDNAYIGLQDIRRGVLRTQWKQGLLLDSPGLEDIYM